MVFETQRSHGDGAYAAADGLDQFPDTQRFLELLSELTGPPPAGVEQPEHAAARGLLRPEGDIFVARAPGRLDVMGGIADYSGSLVLQLPLAEACHVAVQRHPLPSSAAGSAAGGAGGAEPTLRIVSFATEGSHRSPSFALPLAELAPGGQPLTYEAARALFKRDPQRSWAAYVAGGLVVLQRETGARFEDGLSILVASDVPEGKGVSSSAAVEVASMAAVAAAYGILLEGRELALLCQRVENAVVGAPCGVMDQMTAALGEADRLLALRCQPAEVQGCAPIPPHLRFWGIDSGKAHCVGGSDYAHVRVGAFMGLRICSALAAKQAACSGGSSGSSGGAANGNSSSGGGEAELVIGGGHLANVPPSQFASRFEQQLPEALSGAAFLEQYGPHLDSVTSVDPEQTYAVRLPTAHPVHENYRVHAFRQVLAAPAGREQLEVLGELMRQSHASYSRCGLGSEGTDRLVALVQEEQDAAVARGEEPPLFGAKITGGGCGGTVGILAVAGPAGDAAVQRVVQRYAVETGSQSHLFQGSSSGAVAFGTLRLRRQSSAAAAVAVAAADGPV
ncbi:L-arabinokinase-like isoform X2 [Chlorella sorokiniana]|uniref:L-arabinokinase-like isoform X2 n=1 Tax=Chlorella sorokiniana TaxID=3076 RepID=A0A2P6TYH8_CHLSO|nr:L-arabinokinase-like isoform X2 [Chlorella sorokiniana]|eukprot:PRW59111.1 L-arabinokinase-like isoform X2 [Chlorella sorokiniana]